MKKIFILLLALLVVGSASYAAELILITNVSNSVDSISAKDVKKIYLGKKSSWNDGTSIKVFAQKDTDLTNVLVKKYVKKTPQQYFLYWQNAIFTGKGTPPVEVDGNAQMKKIVKAQKGAIGYIDASELDSSVKKLTVN